MMVDGQRKWVSFQGFDYDDEDFVKIGVEFMNKNSHFVKTGKVGQADALLIQQKPMVDFAVHWMNTNRFSES
jgi:aminoglycoside 3-N-acetyltransferase